jgi:hypothetical protein
MAFSDAKQCNAKAKSTGEQCRLPAITGGSKCRLHGGKSLKGVDSPVYKTGRYSKYVSHDIQANIADLDSYSLLDLADELQTQRALIAKYLDRFREGYPMQEQNIGTIVSWLNSVGIMVERMIKIRNETALTGAEIAHLKLRTADLVVKYIDDPERRRQFVSELFQIQQPALTE